MKNVIIGSWALYCDDCSGENVMVKIIDKDDLNREATVVLNLAVRKGEQPQQYKMKVSYKELKQPKLRVKRKI